MVVDSPQDDEGLHFPEDENAHGETMTTMRTVKILSPNTTTTNQPLPLKWTRTLKMSGTNLTILTWTSLRVILKYQ
jgi:hypothetical protein